MRRAALLGALAAGLLLAGCGDDEEEPAPTATPTVTATATPSPEATPAATPAATASVLDQALWPSEGGTDPLEVARSFVAEYIGIEGDPQLGEFQQGDSRSGEVPVHRRAEDGRRLDKIVSTLLLRQLEGERWHVIGAVSDEVELSAPEPLAEITSPVTVAGRGRGFEGNVVLEVRAQFATDALAQEAVIGGSMAALKPFSTELTFAAPDTATGAIVAKTGSGITTADGFAAFPIRF